MVPGAGGYGGGGGGSPTDQGSFCERHKTTCNIGKWIGKKLGGGCRQRSSCWTVAPADEKAFVEGRVAQYKVWETTAAIARGLGVSNSDVEDTFTYAERARIHINAFVPMCEKLEGDRLTCDPNDAYGKALRAASYLAFENAVRAGLIDYSGAQDNDRSGGDAGSGGTGEGGKGGSAWGGASSPLLAGMSTTTLVVIALLAVGGIAAARAAK